MLASLDDASGSADIGAFAVESDIAWVYLTCEGTGEIRIVIDPIGSFPLLCEDTGTASANQFQVSDYQEYSVRIEPGPAQTWAVTVADDA